MRTFGGWTTIRIMLRRFQSRRVPQRDPERLRYSLITDPETSARLARVRQHSTSAERKVRGAIHGLGIRYRIHNRDLPGSPDLANRARGWAVFVHGCFWHRHRGCPRATTPKRNRMFWEAKFEANRARDRKKARELRTLGFRVLTVWECESERPQYLERRLRSAFLSMKTRKRA